MFVSDKIFIVLILKYGNNQVQTARNNCSQQGVAFITTHKFHVILFQGRSKIKNRSTQNDKSIKAELARLGQ